ncbi:hypothetical protein T12_2369 [Trichinella patagoniensis]|uniref:Uncharacterized protein n=1 Tax=Trichinella patagoniensis TaxID=990121 RepID=A0A0V0YZX5_9BILA|nr:hypothetical protein T12_2369 [Trichinella patagoniensis]
MTNSDINTAKLATIFSLYRISKETIKVVVFHWRSPDHRANDGNLTISHLCYTFHVSSQSQTRVKLNRMTRHLARFGICRTLRRAPAFVDLIVTRTNGGNYRGDSVVGTEIRARLQGGGSGGAVVFRRLLPITAVRLGIDCGLHRLRGFVFPCVWLASLLERVPPGLVQRQLLPCLGACEEVPEYSAGAFECNSAE